MFVNVNCVRSLKETDTDNTEISCETTSFLWGSKKTDLLSTLETSSKKVILVIKLLSLLSVSSVPAGIGSSNGKYLHYTIILFCVSLILLAIVFLW